MSGAAFSGAARDPRNVEREANQAMGEEALRELVTSTHRPFLEKSLIVVAIQCDAYLRPSCVKNLRYTKNGLLTNMVQRHKLTRMDFSRQALYLVQRRIDSATKSLSEFRFGMSIPYRSSNKILPTQNLNRRHRNLRTHRPSAFFL